MTLNQLHKGRKNSDTTEGLKSVTCETWTFFRCTRLNLLSYRYSGSSFNAEMLKSSENLLLIENQGGAMCNSTEAPHGQLMDC